MNIPDLINGSFELIGSIALGANVRKLYRDKQVRGTCWPASLFFAAWGFYNLFFYPHLNQWASFIGGCFIVAANVAWVSLAIRYRRS